MDRDLLRRMIADCVIDALRDVTIQEPVSIHVIGDEVARDVLLRLDAQGVQWA